MVYNFDKVKLGRRIRELRLKQGLSQEELCNKTDGLEPTYLSKIETGKYTPSLQTFVKIVNALNIGFDTFFEYEHLLSEKEIDSVISSDYNTLSLKKKRTLYRYIQIMKESD